MIIAGTGHRPNKLGGYNYATENRLLNLCIDYLKTQIRPNADLLIISGMALGFDQALSLACIELKLPFVAAVPFRGQESKWPREAQTLYNDILKKAMEVHIVDPNGYSQEAMYKRNMWMVDRCNKMVSLWDGSPGGTEHCLRYAKTKKRPVDPLWEIYKRN